MILNKDKVKWSKAQCRQFDEAMVELEAVDWQVEGDGNE